MVITKSSKNASNQLANAVVADAARAVMARTAFAAHAARTARTARAPRPPKVIPTYKNWEIIPRRVRDRTVSEFMTRTFHDPQPVTYDRTPQGLDRRWSKHKELPRRGRLLNSMPSNILEKISGALPLGDALLFSQASRGVRNGSRQAMAQRKGGGAALQSELAAIKGMHGSAMKLRKMGSTIPGTSLTVTSVGVQPRGLRPNVKAKGTIKIGSALFYTELDWKDYPLTIPEVSEYPSRSYDMRRQDMQEYASRRSWVYSLQTQTKATVLEVVFYEPRGYPAYIANVYMVSDALSADQKFLLRATLRALGAAPRKTAGRWD